MAGSLSAGNSLSTTLPSTCATVPLVRVAASVTIVSFLCPRPQPLGASARDDLEDLRGDRGLARLVIGQRQVAEQLGGVVGRVLHGHHLRRVEASHSL